MSFHENADECMTIDFLREVPVGSELFYYFILPGYLILLLNPLTYSSE